MIRATARRSLLTWRQLAAHGQSQKLCQHNCISHKHHFHTGFTCASLQRRCPIQVATLRRSASVTTPIFHVASSSLCSCRGAAQCGDPLVPPLIQLQIPRVATLLVVTERSVAKLSLRRNLAPAFCNSQTKKLQVFVHCLEIQVFCSQVSADVMSTKSSRPFDVSIDHEVAMCGSPCRCIQLDFQTGTVDSVAQPFRFDFNSLLLQNHAEITQH